MVRLVSREKRNGG